MPEDVVSPRKFWQDDRTWLAVYVVVGIAWCLQTVLSHLYSKTLWDCTYFTFQQSFFDLVQHQPLYPGHANNVFKYSPTFALLFAPIAVCAAGVGMFLWSVLNFGAYSAAIYSLPLSRVSRVIMLWVALGDLMTAMRDWQSNGLVTACIIGAFLCLRKGWPEVAAAFVVLALNIKIYGAIAGIFFLFYPGKFRFLISGALIAVAFFLLPLVVLSWSELMAQYAGWYRIIHMDASGYVKLSAMGLLNTITGWKAPIPGTEIVALLVILAPFTRLRFYNQPVFQMRMLASVLIGLVIFNHMADRQSFAIAAAGAVLWYMVSRKDAFRTVLFALIVPFSSRLVLHPPTLKVLPFLIIWVLLQTEIWRMREEVAAAVPSGGAFRSDADRR